MNPKHLIFALLIMLCPIGMAAQTTITRSKPKPAVTRTKPKPRQKPVAKPKAKPTPRRNNTSLSSSTSHSDNTSSTTGLSAEINKLINNMVYVSGGTFTMGGGTSEQGSEAYGRKSPPTASPSAATTFTSMR